MRLMVKRDEIFTDDLGVYTNYDDLEDKVLSELNTVYVGKDGKIYPRFEVIK